MSQENYQDDGKKPAFEREIGADVSSGVSGMGDTAHEQRSVQADLSPKAASAGQALPGLGSGGADFLHAMRHSLAHIMATAIQKLWPDAKFGVGPVIENGFYYDVDLGETKISESDFKKIEEAMRQVINSNVPFEKFMMPIDEAIRWAQDSKQPYKVELLNDLKRAGTTVAKDLNPEEMGTIAGPKSSEASSEGGKVDEVSFYKDGDFTDLCRGPHVESTGKVGAFKLMSVAGAYWRGKETNPQMQRIYGVAFETKEELAKHLEMLEEAKKRDHRKLGADLDLFFFHETSPGMAYWLPKGVILYNELIRFWREEHTARGYQEIVSPLINKKELYQTSGHFDHYWEDMFTIETEDDESYGVKPMNCPNAMVVFSYGTRSYRELPLRLSDTDTLHRYELSGALNGLFRVREFRQDDAHIFVSEDQIKDEYKRVFEITELFYAIFSIDYSFRLGTRPDKFLGDIKQWDRAEKTLREILEDSGKEYVVEEGDGAFYGPKIDILMKDSLGRPWQMGTIQLDFQQPLRFDLKYAAQDGTEKTPIAIHRVIYGSLERFIGILIEHLAGKFPIWLAPEQIRIASVNQQPETLKFVGEFTSKAAKLGLRVGVDNDNESVGKKIRSAELMKVPYVIIAGEKEIETGKVLPRTRRDMVVQELSEPINVDDFLATVANEVTSRVSKSSF